MMWNEKDWTYGLIAMIVVSVAVGIGIWELLSWVFSHLSWSG